jgi:hypothetical protein
MEKQLKSDKREMRVEMKTDNNGLSYKKKFQRQTSKHLAEIMDLFFAKGFFGKLCQL